MADEEPGESQRAAVRPPTGRHFARNLDWNLLRAFHEIVLAGGISRAAQRTGQKRRFPVVSRRYSRSLVVARKTLCLGTVIAPRPYGGR